MLESVFTVAGLQAFITRRHLHRYLPLNFAKFLRATFLQNPSDGCFRYQQIISRECAFFVAMFTFILMSSSYLQKLMWNAWNYRNNLEKL